MSDSWRLSCCYAIGGFLAWLAYSVIGLRRSVIRGNLARSFPEWSSHRTGAVAREFSKRQGELVAEALYGSSISEAELRERVTITNPQVIAPGDAPRTLVLVGAHHGNFEWLLYRLSLEFPGRFAGLYKPGRNARVDAWLTRRRARFVPLLAPGECADPQQTLEAYVRAVETAVRKQPARYFWAYNRWKRSRGVYD